MRHFLRASRWLIYNSSALFHEFIPLMRGRRYRWAKAGTTY
jgi:hypothetical protein